MKSRNFNSKKHYRIYNLQFVVCNFDFNLII